MSQPLITPSFAQALPQKTRISRSLRRAGAVAQEPAKTSVAKSPPAPAPMPLSANARSAHDKLRQQARTVAQSKARTAPAPVAPNRSATSDALALAVAPAFSRPLAQQAPIPPAPAQQTNELIPRAGEAQEKPEKESSSQKDMLLHAALKAGIALYRYNEVQPDPNTPPGSHYPSWMWDAMDREGYVTVELHIDEDYIRRSLSSDPVTRSNQRDPWFGESEQDKKERQQQGKRLPNIGELRPLPKKDGLYHCLVHLPEPRESLRWGRAKRLLFVPQTHEYQRLMDDREEQGAYRYQSRFSQKQGPQRINHPIAGWKPSTLAVNQWLRPVESASDDPQGFHQMIISGCAIAATELDRAPEDYWLILSESDTYRYVQSQLLSDPLKERSKAPDRWLGELRVNALYEAMNHALSQRGAIAPSQWSEEDRTWWQEENAKWQDTLRAKQHAPAEAEELNPILKPMPASAPLRPRM